jgi:signal peptidase I
MDRKRNFWGVVKKLLRNFFLPEINRKLLIRLVVISGICLLFFLFFKPCFISGSSMEPAWHDNGFTLSFRWKYLYSYPQHGDVVTISYFGKRELLKRVVALPGIAFNSAAAYYLSMIQPGKNLMSYFPVIGRVSRWS